MHCCLADTHPPHCGAVSQVAFLLCDSPQSRANVARSWGCPAGLAVALAVVARDRKLLLRDSARLNDATAYAESHTCPLFVEPGQATLQPDRKPASAQPLLFEELSASELTAVHLTAASACTLLAN